MALPSSGPISLLQIYAEYGAPIGTPLTAMVRGGAYVPNTAPNMGIPTSPPINLQHFYGGSGSSPFSALKSGDAVGSIFITEPPTAPASVTVTSNVVDIICGGGTGSYTCAWSHLSGSTAIGTPGANVFSTSFSGDVPKNSTLSAVKRCAASDGVTTINVDVSVDLDYSAGA